MLRRSLLVILVACHGAPFGAWSTSVGGTRDLQCAGEGVAVSASGEVAMVWHTEGAGRAMAISRYDARGRLAWTHELTAPACKRLGFGGAVAFAPDGGVVAAASAAPGQPVCVIAYDADGALRWSQLLASARGIPAIAVDAGGRVVATNRHDYDHLGHVSVLGAGGAVAWERDMPVLVEAMAIEPDGSVAIAGNAVANGALVDLDPEAPGVQSAEIVAFAPDGTPREAVPVPIGKPGPAGPDLRLATGGHARYVAWNVIDPATGLGGRLTKLVDGKPAWTHDVAPIGQLAGAGARVVLLTQVRGTPTALLLDGDGATIASWELHGARIGRELSSAGAVEAIGATPTALVLAGFGEKRFELGAAGSVKSECWTEDEVEHDDTPRTIEVEHCAEVAFVARYALPP